MLPLQFGAILVCFVLFGEMARLAESLQQPAHAALFFSGPLEEKLGVYKDQERAKLSCNGGSRNGDRITYKWFRNSKELSTLSLPRHTATASGDLLIYPSDFSKDDGNYQCMITDSTVEKWSLLSNTATLNLAYMSGLTKRDVTMNGEEGKGWKYIFSGYSYSKFPKATFIWTFRRQTLKESKRISVSEDGNLYIAQLTFSEAGKYSFEMKFNSPYITQRRESVTLQISRQSTTSDIPATFMLGPRSQRISLKREKEVTFECFPTGKPMPDIYWKKDGRRLNNGEKYRIKDFNKRLTVRDLNVADSGKYQCEITRAAVQSRSEATLTVIAPPVVKALEPANQIRHIGNFTLLTCMVTGSFTGVHFSVSWYRNGVKLSPSSRIVMTSRTYRDYRNFTLNVTRLQKFPDGGMYQCFAKNDGGEDMAYTAVDVQSLPANITYGPGVVYAVRGKPARIRCIARGSPPITFKWEKNGRPITYLDPPNNGKNGTYVISNVQSSDVAQYTCIATNGPRPIDTDKSTGRLEIVASTVVVNQSSTVYAPKGSHRYLRCGVRFDRKVNVTYRWYLNGQPVKGGHREVKYDGRLVISGVSERDQGIYRCDASSVVGRYSTTTELIVQAPPTRTSTPVVDDIRPDSVRLRWRTYLDGNSAISHYIIGLKYVDNGTEVVAVPRAMASGEPKKYVVPGLIPYTKYQFRIRAVNGVGYSPWSGYSKTEQTLESAPSYQLKKVTGKAVDDNTIEVTWEKPPTWSHNGKLLGYYVAWKYAGVTSGQFTTKKVEPSSERKLLITNLILNSPYEVKVQMFNSAGAGPFSKLVVIKTKEGLPTGAPQQFAVRNVSSRSVLLEWDTPPPQDWNGQLTTYIIRLWEFDKEGVVQQRRVDHDPSAFIQVFNVTNLKTFTQYVFKISAYNSVGGGPEAGPIQVRTTEDIPSAPRSLSIVEQYSDSISVSWVRPREVNGVLTGYLVKYWRVGATGGVKEEVVGGNALQAGITSLQSKTAYMISVAARTKAGISASARIEGRTLDDPVEPSAPSNLRFVEFNATTVELTWQEGSKGRSPIIEYVIEGNNETGFANDRTSEWFDALIVKDPFKIYNLPPVIIENLRPATIYRFRVKAVNKVGSSPWSPVSSGVTIGEAAPLLPPLNIVVSKRNLNPGELLLRWTMPPKETWNSVFITYTIVLQEQGDVTNNTRFTTSGIGHHVRSFKIPALKKFTTYEIRMKTVNKVGESPYSPMLTGQTEGFVPDRPPENIQAIGASGSSINITWDEVHKDSQNGDVLGYKILYRLFRYAVQEFTEIDVGNVRRYTLKNLLGYTQYDIRLLAYTKLGDGKRSDALQPYPRTLETKPGPPSRVRFPTIDASLVVVTWDVPEMTGGYILMYRVNYRLRDDVNAPLIKRPTLAASKRSDTVLGLATDKFYVFEVQAKTSVGWGKPATAEIFTTREGNKGKAAIPLILPISDSHITSRSIKVRWAVETRRRQPIRYFTIQLRKGQGAWETHRKPLGGDVRELVVWGLASYHFYSFRIRSTTDANNSPYSEPSSPVRTLRKSIFGAPRDVRITSPSSTSLAVEWKPPSLVETQATIHQYFLGYRLHDPNPTPSSGYIPSYLPSSDRKYTIRGLDEFTLYDIILYGIDEFKQPLASYTETRRTAARLPPTPRLLDRRDVGPTSITIFWEAPSSTQTSVLGYKAEYNIPSKRRRRAIKELCEPAEPGAAYFSNTSTQGTITNLNMFTRYRIVLRSYNSAGNSPGSDPINEITKEGVPGPPSTFDFDGVYGTEIHLYWEPPCERNGRLRNYRLTVSSDGRGKEREVKLGADVTEHKVRGLVLLTNYKFELVAMTSIGAGIPKILETKTKGAAVKPERPTDVRASAEKNVVTLTWRNGFHGNTPVTYYIIEYKRSSEKSPWAEGWRLKASEVNKNRTDRTMWVALRDLEPYTIYWFRIAVQNEVAVSQPSDRSDSVTTGERNSLPRSTPVYEKIWFIAVMAVIGFLILVLLLICIICLCRGRRRGGKRIDHPLEMGIQPSQGLRQYSSAEDNFSNGTVKSNREEKPLVNDSEEEEENEDEEEQASSLESKSDLDETESEDDIPKKKRQMEAALREQDKYYPHNKPPRSFSSDNVHGSPPPAYATFASRYRGRSEPFLDPDSEFDNEDDGNGKPVRNFHSPFQRTPTRRAPRSAFTPYDGDSSDSSEIQRRKRGDPRSSSFRRALISGKPEPEPERPIGNERDSGRRPKPTPRKYRSLEQAVNESAKPPTYEDDDDDDVDVRIRQPGLPDRYSSPPEYRSDSGRDSSDDHDRVSLAQSASRSNPPERSESPVPEYHSSTDDSLDNPDKQRLVNGRAKPEPEISSYSSFV